MKIEWKGKRDRKNKDKDEGIKGDGGRETNM